MASASSLKTKIKAINASLSALIKGPLTTYKAKQAAIAMDPDTVKEYLDASLDSKMSGHLYICTVDGKEMACSARTQGEALKRFDEKHPMLTDVLTVGAFTLLGDGIRLTFESVIEAGLGATSDKNAEVYIRRVNPV